MANGFMSLSYKDYSKEISTFRVEIPLYTAVNFASQETLRGDLISAAGVITLGSLTLASFGNDVKYAGTPPTDENAQVERGWLIRYQDATTFDNFFCTLPCAEAAEDYLLPNTDLADLENADIAAFVTAFEALVVAPRTTHAVTVTGMELVGRKR